MDLGLQNKKALVFAASRGLGEASAHAFAAEGAAVAIASRNQPSISAAAARIREAVPGADVHPYVCDVADAAAIDQTVTAAAAALGGLDVVVCNAGGPPARPFVELSDADWQAAFELNLLSVVRIVRAALPHLRPGGAIVTITSASVKEPVPGLILSNAIRSGVLGLVKTLANELGSQGIRVVNVAPGRIYTDRLKELDQTNAARQGTTPEAVRKQVEAGIPLGRYGDPAEFGRVVCFAASPAAGYISGTTILVDGGMVRAIT